MITNSGKLILGKYLINQAPAYASYIAVGCGADPRTAVSFSVIKKALSGTTATLTTDGDHDLRKGDSVLIAGCGGAFNGVYTITNVTATTIQYTVAALPTITQVDPSTPNTGYAKYTTNADHGLIPGDKITITGITTTAYNQSGVTIYRVTSANTFVVEEVDTTTPITIGSPVISVDETEISVASVTLDFQSKKTLDLEMFRVPIISRSFINEDGVSKVVFSAELPTSNRYEMTEVGVYSAGSNPVTSNSDSRSLLLFSENVESWEYHSGEDITNIYQPLDIDSNTLYTIQDGLTGNINAANITNDKSFFSSASDTIFDYVNDSSDRQNRIETKERPRFYDSFLSIRGNTSTVGITSSISSLTASSNVVTIVTSTNHNLLEGDTVTISGVTSDVSPSEYNFTNALVDTKINATAFTINSTVVESNVVVTSATAKVIRGGDHIHNNTIRLDLGNNSADDELILGFSLLKNTPQTNNGLTSQSDANQPDNIYITLEFSNDETEAISTQFARFEAVLTSADIDQAKDSLYFVVKKKLSELSTTSSFSWSNVRIVKVFVCVEEDNAPSSNYYVALDALRFENISAIDSNPLYGLVAYSTIGNSDSSTISGVSFGKPVTKKPNTNNLVEFKFAIGVS